MFLSKIWIFLLAVAAAIAFTIALVMPRPAGRDTVAREAPRLVEACSFTNILLQTNARARIDLADSFSRAPGLAKAMKKANTEEKVSVETNSTVKKAVRGAITELEKAKVPKDLIPDFVYLVDSKGRIIAREGSQAETKLYGKHYLSGYFAVDDALHGYIRDDLWVIEKNKRVELYRVAVAPVIRRGATDKLVGAVILGHELDVNYAKELGENLRIDVNFYAKGHMVANSKNVQITDAVTKAYDDSKWGDDLADDCAKSKPFVTHEGHDNYKLVIARLPGEAGENQHAFFAIYLKRAGAVGFSAMLGKAKKGDLSFGNFPWLGVILLFLLAVGVGLFLTIWESDLPLRRLAADALAMAKGEKDRLDEDNHRGKFGSIARSVNIQLDKLARESKAAKKDLDQLLGPAPEGGLALKGGFYSSGGISLGDDEPMFSPPPPPASFGAPKPAAPPPAPPRPPATPPPRPATPRPATPPPGASPFDLDLPPPPAAIDASPQAPTHDQVVPPPVSLPSKPAAPPPPLPSAIDDDILADHDLEPEPSLGRPPSDFDAPTRVASPSDDLLSQVAADDDSSYRKVYDDFIALKQKCGESTSSLTYDKFTRKLNKNRQALMAKHNCKSVRFKVYEKNGKAALKATPVKS